MYLNNHNLWIIVGDDLKVDQCQFESGLVLISNQQH